MKKFTLFLAMILCSSALLVAQVSVHVSGTVTRDSTNLPVVNHEVIISADSNSSGFYFSTQRFTNPNGFYDCTIQNVPGGVQTTFTVKTINCDSLYLLKTFQTSNSPAVENFVLCNNPVSCQAGFTAYADSSNAAEFHFVDNSTPAGGVTSWHWNFDDGTPPVIITFPQNPNVTHVFAGAGIVHNVCLTISTSTGCTSVKCNEIHIIQPNTCEAHFTYSHDSIHFVPFTCHFTDTSTGNPTSWFWNFGDPISGLNGTSNEKNPTHVYILAGTYVVCHSISGLNCQSTVCDTLRIGPQPAGCTSSFTYTRNFLTVIFESHITSQYATTYSWNFGNPGSGATNTSVEKNPHHVYSAPGSYVVTLTTIDANGCTWSSTQTIFVSATCDVNGSVTMGNTYVDHGQIDLIKIDSGNVMTVVQSHTFGDSLGMYHFGGVAQGHYYLKAQLLSNSTRYGDFVPTYYHEAINWANATVIELGAPANPYNFHLVEVGTLAPGNGAIGGTVSQGTKVSSGGTPVPNVEVLLLNSSNAALAVSVTDVNGHFNFSSIGMGAYIVYPEVAGLTTIPAHIILDDSHLTATTPFSLKNSQVIYGLNNQLPRFINSISDLYPNPPAGGMVSLNVSVSRETGLDLTLFDQTGQAMREWQYTMHKGDNTMRFSTSELAKGPYYLRIRTDEGSIVFRKLFIVK